MDKQPRQSLKLLLFLFKIGLQAQFRNKRTFPTCKFKHTFKWWLWFYSLMSDVAVVTMSEKGQIVLPKKTRENLRLKKGDKLLLVEEDKRISLSKVSGLSKSKDVFESLSTMLASEKVLAKDWNFKGDDIWDEP